MTYTLDGTNFGVVDFVVFAATMAISVMIGLYFAYQDRNKKGTTSYMFGDKKMSPFAVSMSLAVTYVSAITVLAYPVEVYSYGGVFIWSIAGIIIGAGFSAVYFIPLFCDLQLNTVYEYLELRFSRTIRIAVSLLNNARLIFYMGITIYLPSLAISAVTPLDLNASIALTSIICTFYTTLGGMKAVVWTDVLQGGIMILGSMTVFIKVAVMLGGPNNVWESIHRGGRDNFWKISWDPRTRSSVIPIIVGSALANIKGAGVDQAMVQRYLSCGTTNKARQSLMLKIIPTSMFKIISVLSGLAMYAYYEGCDPYVAGVVKKHDQILPLLVVTIFKDMPGMAGLFVAAAFSGTLSTVSSGLNAVATVIMTDYILVLRPNIEEKYQLLLTKLSCLVVGLIVTSMAFVASFAKGTIFRLIFATLGASASPVAALFYFAFFPFVNTTGAMASFVVSLGFGLWIAVGTLSYGPNPDLLGRLPLDTENCNLTNDITTSTPNYVTDIFSTQTSAAVVSSRPYLADTLYSLSPFLLGVVVMFVALFTGIVVSLLTGPNKSKNADPRLFIPLVNHPWFSDSVNKFFRFGVPESSDIKGYYKPASAADDEVKLELDDKSEKNISSSSEGSFVDKY